MGENAVRVDLIWRADGESSDQEGGKRGGKALEVRRRIDGLKRRKG